MKNLKLERFGVQEMDAKEMLTVDAGNPIVLLFAGGLLGIALYAAYEIGRADGNR
ncbi:hypothetical protein IM793_07455 [Pedobacter sp. MR2016-19]|uniref:hypothetical protein n=1 Tax=unclassified Pedobacter TaxID=2628915 RepID=UPI00187565A7|nr:MULTISPECIES: hypothetical protein [unclassified Pedobacter]MBE5318986.1 hypothetical protein [Pedobacter sp. MR2016-19]QXU40495.1 hypothetical protein KYH19_15980 [Pedobacter sp. D749]